MKSTSIDLVFEQAVDGSHYSDLQLKDIAELIYQTDPYVYPALFRSQENAEAVIPSLIRENDAMFRKDNLFLAKADGRIVGLILWKQGPLEWADDILTKESSRLGIKTSPYLDLVKREYFEFYKSIPEDVISIINVCVKADFRNYGIGRKLFCSFLEAHPDCGNFELLVLEDNKNAVHLYETAGFSITQVFQGFSVDNRDLPCLKMEKRI